MESRWIFNYLPVYFYRMISSFHHRYAQITVEITTDDPEPVTEAFISNFRHGMSEVDDYGAISKKHLYN